MLTYLIIYSIVSSSVVLLLNANQVFHFNQISSITNSKIKTLTFIALFSLGGLPPFLGFLPKLLIIYNMSLSLEHLLWLALLLGGSLITLFYYVRITFTTLTLSSPKLKTTFQAKLKIPLYIIRFTNFLPLLFPLLSFYQA